MTKSVEAKILQEILDMAEDYEEVEDAMGLYERLEAIVDLIRDWEKEAK